LAILRKKSLVLALLAIGFVRVFDGDAFTQDAGRKGQALQPNFLTAPTADFPAGITSARMKGINFVGSDRVILYLPFIAKDSLVFEPFSLTSAASVDGGTLPAEYSCDGSGSSPALSWVNAPAGSQGFALMMTTIPVDGATKWNWVLYGLPGSITNLAKNSSGVGIPGVNSHGTMAYAPPCSQGPRAKIYTFTLYALSASPTLPVEADRVTGEVLIKAISSITLGSASLNLSFTRSQ